MRLDVQVFASLRQVAGAPVVGLDVPESCTVRELLERFGEVYPRVAGGLGSIRVAVNEEYSGPDTEVTAGDRVALLPPVSGGGGG